jgi:hypothetical protein
MNQLHNAPHDHKFCTHCTSSHHLTLSTPVFWEMLKHNDSVIYCVCQSCSNQFNLSNFADKKAMVQQCFKNVKETPPNSDGSYPYWAFTTSLTLKLNGYDLLRALKNGHQLSRSEYFSLCAQEQKVMAPPKELLLAYFDFEGGSENEIH